MKVLIKRLLREQLLDEKVLRVNDLPETAGLFIHSKSGDRFFELNLYCPKTDTIYATISVSNLKGYDNLYQVNGVAAVTGFGPFIYELVMMFLDSKGKEVMPSRDGDVRKGAFNIWQKMFYLRNDVNKTTYNVNDKIYGYEILGFDVEIDEREEFLKDIEEDGGFEDYQITALEVFNASYSLKPNNDFHELVNRAKSYNKEIYEKAKKRGDEFFEEKYD